MSRNYFKKGSWNVIDDVSGFKTKASKVRLRWDGLYTTDSNWEPRHPQELIRARTDNMSVPFSRPRTADEFITYGGAKAIGTINQSVLNGSIINGRSIPLTASEFPPSPTFPIR